MGARDYRLLRGMVSESRWERRGSTRVLFWDRKLWYRSAIVLEKASCQYLTVWARFVLFTSSLLFCRFSTLLTRYVRRKPVD